MKRLAVALFSNSKMNFTPIPDCVTMEKISYRLFATCAGWRPWLLSSVFPFLFFYDINYMRMNSQSGENHWFISPCHESFSSQHLHFICFKLFFSPAVNKFVMPPMSDYCGGILALLQNNRQDKNIMKHCMVEQSWCMLIYYIWADKECEKWVSDGRRTMWSACTHGKFAVLISDSLGRPVSSLLCQSFLFSFVFLCSTSGSVSFSMQRCGEWKHMVYNGHKMAHRAPMEGFPMNHCYI